MDPAQNPYTPSAGARPPALVGRNSDLDAFRTALARLGNGRHARSFILDGLRGVGKTVLLTEFDSVAREAGWISSGTVECNEDDDLRELVARLAHRTLRRLSRSRRTGAALGRALGALKSFTFTLDDTGRWRLGFDVEAIKGTADSGDPEEDIVELFAEIGRAAAEQGSGVVFLLDEMQSLGRDELALLAAVFHRISQDLTPVLLAGAGLPQLPLMLHDAKPYAERLFAYRTIGSLRTSVAAQALSLPLRHLDVAYRPDALGLVLEHAGGYPYFLQQWGETIWNESEGPGLTVEDVVEAEEIVNDELDRRFFRDRYEKATQAERIYMAAMADLGDGPHPSAEIAARMAKTQGQLSVRRDGLIKKGLIYNPVDTDLEFTVPQFASFMRRAHPYDPDERPRRGRPPGRG